jgi:anti-sigma factor RsiW
MMHEFDPIDEQLSGYLDGEVTDAERREIEALLEAEPERRAALEELAEARALVRSLPWVDLSDAALERLIEVVSAVPERAPVVALDARRRGGRRLAAWTAVGSAAAAIAVAVVLPSREPQVTPAVATLSEAHSAQASTTPGDPVPALAAMSVPVRFGR